MGHRSNFVIIQNREINIYYSHWGAISIPKDIFYGPQITIDYIKSLQPVETLLDDLWCEGAVLVDTHEKQLIFWGGDGYEYPAVRKYFISLLQLNWEGWGIRWAEQGIIDIAQYLRIDISQVQTDIDYYHWKNYRGWLENSETDYTETLLTVKYHPELILDYRFDNYLTELLSTGSSLFELLQSCDLIAIPDEEKVCSGAYLNLFEKEIWVWWGRPTDERVLSKILRHWHGWTVKRHTEGLPFQVELSGRSSDFIRMEAEAVIEQILDDITKNDRFDPKKWIDTIASNCVNIEYADIWINPDTLDNYQPQITDREKQQVLQRIIKLLED